MREPDPDRVMARISARTFQEWMAFDRAFGSIDGMYDREVMAELHELLQLNNQLTGAAITRRGKKNPAGKFQRAPRPWLPQGVLAEIEDEDDEDEEELNERERMARFDAEVFGGSPQPLPTVDQPTITLDDAVIAE